MPIISSQIVSQTPQVDGRVSVTERHTDHNGADHDVSYLAAADMDIYAVLSARAAKMGAEIDRREAVEAESNNFEIPLSQVEFLKRFTQLERKAVYEAKRTDSEVEDVWNFVTTAVNGIRLSNPLTIYGLSLLESKGLIAAGRAAEIGATNG